MATDRSAEIEIITGTLLRLGDWVAEISRIHVITRIWTRKNSLIQSAADNYLGKKITATGNNSIIALCDKQVACAFATGEDDYIEYSIRSNSTPVTYAFRILNCHPDKDFLFVVIENLSSRKVHELIEDKWKLALDASGDGAFDANLETNTIEFSQKWRNIFGYSPGEITKIDEWRAKVHPEDIPIVVNTFEQYLSGKIPVYSIELRYLCKDGSYKWVLRRGIVISRAEDGKPLRFVGTLTDINTLKITEEGYRGTTELLANLLNNLQISILVIDENWKAIFVNQVYYDLYAGQGNPEKLVGMDMKEQLERMKYAYKDPDKFYRRTMEMFEKKEVVINDELEMTDGKVISRDYIPLLLGNNKGGIWKFKDITRQKNVEKRFEAQRLFYERILNNIPAHIAVFDKEHKYLFVNKNAFKNDDLRKWMIGKTDEDYARYSNQPDSFVGKRFAMYDCAVAEGKVEFIEKMVDKDGKIGHHLRLIHPVFYEDDSLEFVMSYGVEITDLIVAQDELKTSIDMFASAFNYSGIGMALISLDGKWLDVNEVLCGLTGYTKKELLGFSYHDITYPEDDEMDRRLINRLLKMELSTYTIEKRYVSKANKIILASLTVSLVWNRDETPKFFIAQVVDITEKKALENDIKRKNFELEATRVSLVNKILQLEELSHIIAHNLRGPAGNVKMLSQMLLEKQGNNEAGALDTLSDAFKEDEIVKYIYESSNSLMESLSTLMEITEIKLNKEIPYNNCDLALVINGIVSQLQSIIYEKKAVIQSELEVKTVHYPKAYLENILYNLFSNALKYSSLNTAPQIVVSAKLLENKKTQLIVRDNGIGIDLEKYGDKVFKLNQIFHTGYDSKGIGLYITKTQIESLGGSITIKSKPDEGCEFIVIL